MRAFGLKRIFLVLLVSIPVSAAADDNVDSKSLSTSALDPRIEPYIAPKPSSLPSLKNSFLDENKIAIGTILRSHHFDKDKYDYHDYNESHNGVYLSINRWSMGSFTNSADKQSVFMTYNLELYQNQTFTVDMVTGVANGYEGWENAQGDYLPILGVSTQWAFLKSILTFDSVTFGMELPLN